jgi:hypothetical protein
MQFTNVNIPSLVYEFTSVNTLSPLTYQAGVKPVSWLRSNRSIADTELHKHVKH